MGVDSVNKNPHESSHNGSFLKDTCSGANLGGVRLLLEGTNSDANWDPNSRSEISGKK